MDRLLPQLIDTPLMLIKGHQCFRLNSLNLLFAGPLCLLDSFHADNTVCRVSPKFFAECRLHIQPKQLGGETRGGRRQAKYDAWEPSSQLGQAYGSGRRAETGGAR